MSANPARGVPNPTQEERQVFESLFKQFSKWSPELNTNVVFSQTVRDLFRTTQVQDPILHEIWSLVVPKVATTELDYLPKAAFDKALRLIGHAQNYPNPRVVAEVADNPAPLPSFFLPLSLDTAVAYAELFHRSRHPQNSLLQRDAVMQSWQRAPLPQPIYDHVWDIVNTEKRTALSEIEFTIGTHLLVLYLDKCLSGTLSTVPADLYEAAMNSLAWPITPKDKSRYDGIFNNLNPSQYDTVARKDLEPSLVRMGFDRGQTLKRAWDLASIRKQSDLTRDEFAVYTYLLQRFKANPDQGLPDILPYNLIPPSLRRIAAEMSENQVPQQPQQPLHQQHPSGSVPVPPAPPPRSNTEDLFGLDSFNSSQSQASTVPSQVQHDNTGGSYRPGSSALTESLPRSPQSVQNTAVSREQNFFKGSFVPSSTFGQSLVTHPTGASNTSSSAPKQASLMDDLLLDNDPDFNKKLTDNTDVANLQNQFTGLNEQSKTLQAKKPGLEKDLAASSNQKRELELRLQQLRSQYDQDSQIVKGLEDKLKSEKSEITQLSQKAALVHASVQDLQGQHQNLVSQLQSVQQDKSTVDQRISEMNAYIIRAKEDIEKKQIELRQQKGRLAISKKQAEALEEEKIRLDKTKSDLASTQQPSASRDGPTGGAASPTPSTASSSNPFMRRSTNQGSIDQKVAPNPSGFESLFSQPFGTATPTNPPPTSFRQEAFQLQAQSGPSIKSSEPDVPTPSTSPPLSLHQDSPQLPAPPASRQITSRDLPLTGTVASNATSVRVETPSSRVENSSSYHQGFTASSPVASLNSEATKKVAEPSFISEQVKETPHLTGSKGDTDAAFANFGKPTSRQPTLDSPNSSDPLAKFNAQFPDLKSKPKDEFPPIKDLHIDESESEDETGGFDDDFTRASPPQVKSTARNPAPLTTMENFFGAASPGGSLPEAPVPPSGGAKQPPQQLSSNDSYSGFKVPGPPQASSMFTTLLTSRSDSQRTSNRSDTFESAASHLSSRNGTNEASSLPVDNFPSKSISSGLGVGSGPSHAPKQTTGAFDDFDGFDDLAEAKEDERDEDLIYGGQHGDDHEFSAAFDSPSASAPASHLAKSTSSNNKASAFPHDNGFADFESAFNSSASIKKNATPGNSGPLASRENEWDAMLKSFDEPTKIKPLGNTEELPEAPEPPPAGSRPSIGRMDTTEHDDPILKRLCSKGFSRDRALNALEKFDYDLDKATHYLTSGGK